MKDFASKLLCLLLLALFALTLPAQTPWKERTLRLYPLTAFVGTAKVGYLHGLAPNWSISASGAYSAFCLRNSNRPTMGMMPWDQAVPVQRHGLGMQVGMRFYTDPATRSGRGYIEILGEARRSFSERYMEYYSDYMDPEITREIAATRTHMGGILQCGTLSTKHRLKWELNFGFGVHHVWRKYSVLWVNYPGFAHNVGFDRSGAWNSWGVSFHLNFCIYLMLKKPEMHLRAPR
jgi:hypothetical protein